MIVDNDPIFRLGFSTALASYPDFQIIAQVNNVANALVELDRGIIPDLIVLELSLGYLHTEKAASWQLCQRLIQQYQDLPIFLLSSCVESKLLKILKNIGIQGYCHKGTEIETVIYAMGRIATGETYWQEISFPAPSFWQTHLARMSRSGQRQIQADLAEINNQLTDNSLSISDRLFLSGRKRELLAAGWIVNQLISTEIKTETWQLSESTALAPIDNTNQSCLLSAHSAIAKLAKEKSIAAEILRRVLSSIELGVINYTGTTLEIDILKIPQRQELLYLVLSKLNELLEKLQAKQNTRLSIEQHLHTIWQSASVDFFFGHCNNSLAITEEQFIEIIEQEATIVQNNIFNQIYFASDLFSYLLLEEPLIIDCVSYRSNSPEAKSRAEFLTQNLIILIANAVIQVFLNNFYNVEIFKYNLYDREYRSSREIARFRNDLSWRYRQEKYWENPNNIFASRYRILVLQNNGIQNSFIYASRVEELNQLQGLPWFATMMIETRDAISPRLRAIISSVGGGIVYVLTQVLGRGIGLIGKGILQGIGSSIQDTRYGEKNQD